MPPQPLPHVPQVYPRLAQVAGTQPPEQLIGLHGTATQANDPMESEAIRIVFGDHTDNIRVSSTKSMHGHTLGAAGAIEGAATVLGLHYGLLPPTANFNEPDPECNINVIANEAIAASKIADAPAIIAFRIVRPAVELALTR